MRVLLITDQQLVQLALTQVIREVFADAQVHTRWRTDEGLAACVEEGPWELVLLDLDTRGARNNHCARKIRLLQQGIKLAALAGSSTRDEHRYCSSIGISACLQKSLPTWALGAALTALLKPAASEALWAPARARQRTDPPCEGV